MDELEKFFLEAEGHGASREQTVEWVLGRAQDALPEIDRALVESIAIERARHRRAA